MTEDAESVAEKLRSHTDDFDFMDTNGSFVRFCFSEIMSRKDALAYVKTLQRDAKEEIASRIAQSAFRAGFSA